MRADWQKQRNRSLKLSIIIVSYNVKYYLEQCLNSVRRAIDGIDAEVFVVDNHSRDGSVSYLHHRFSWVNFIENSHNTGFARANNIAIRQSAGDYVLLLNPDTIVGEHVLTDAISFMDEHEHCGSLGVHMVNPDGTDAMESRRGIPTPMTAFYKMTGLCTRYPDNRRLAHYYLSYLPWDLPSQIEIVSGAFCMLRRSALQQVGLLDEDYFMYGEDIDLSYRLIKAGFENWYLPVKIIHYKGESTRKSSFKYVHVFYNAMLIFFRKHFSYLGFFISMPIKMAVIGKAILALLSQQCRLAVKSLGLLRSRHPEDALYLFLGSDRALAQCRGLARRKGLSGVFIKASEDLMPEGHEAYLAQMSGYKSVCVVYDVDSYSYETIIELFNANSVRGVVLGTYSSRSKTIITPTETFR